MRTSNDNLRYRLSQLLPDFPTSRQDELNPQVAERIASARTAFIHGFQAALKASHENLPNLLKSFPFQKLGFALEGAAMATTMMDELSNSKDGFLTALLYERSETEIVFCAIGVGWATARLRKSPQWLPQCMDIHYKPAVADGFGFHQGFFNSQRFTGNRIHGKIGELNDHYYIGLGRALWFAHLGCRENIALDISKMPPNQRIQLWRGVGTACAFTGNREYAAAIMSAAEGFANKLWEGLENGTQLLHALSHLNKKKKL